MNAVTVGDFSVAGTANVSVNDYIKHYVCRKRFLISNDLQLCSDLFDVSYKLMDVRKITTGADHPNDSGGSESINRAMAQMLTVVIIERKNGWYVPLSHRAVLQ